MWIDLQGLVAGRDELRRDRLAAVLPEAAYRFVVEPEPADEAALDGSRLPQMPIPTAEEYDLRKLDRGLFERLDGEREKRMQSALDIGGRKSMVGSNNWAVASSRSRSGGALLANDMHLGLNVPNIWYRARLVVEPEGLDVIGREPARRSADRRRQQSPCRLGIHQQLRRFPGRHPSRTRPGRGQLSHARRAAQVRIGKRDVVGRGRRARDVRRPQDDLGTGH